MISTSARGFVFGCLKGKPKINQTIIEINELALKGLHAGQIAEELDLARSYVSRMARENGIKLKGSHK